MLLLFLSILLFMPIARLFYTEYPSFIASYNSQSVIWFFEIVNIAQHEIQAPVLIVGVGVKTPGILF